MRILLLCFLRGCPGQDDTVYSQDITNCAYLCAAKEGDINACKDKCYSVYLEGGKGALEEMTERYK